MGNLLKQYQEVVKGPFDNHKGLFVIANNPKNKILLTGINPSDGKMDTRDDVLFKDCRGTYWNPIHHFLGKFDYDTAYVDLFPVHETKEEFFLKIKEGNQNYADYLARILEVTQREIERLNPKLIIHMNAQSRYFWNPNEWLGYEMINTGYKVKNRHLKKITGLSSSPLRINQELKKTVLEETYFLQYIDITSRYATSHPNALISTEEFEELYQWVCNNSTKL